VQEPPHGSLSELPLAGLFDAANDEDWGLRTLQDFSERLDQRQAGEWGIFKLVPDETRYLGRVLVSSDDHDPVELEVWIRSWQTHSWRKPGTSQRLWHVWARLEVGCQCERDHGVHPVQVVRWEAGSVEGLAEACNAALATLDGWFAEGLSAANWRLRAGLPN
jgi:hypothetical protein